MMTRLLQVTLIGLLAAAPAASAASKHHRVPSSVDPNAAMFTAAEASVSAMMKDPGSTQFQSAHIEATCGETAYVVGKYNSKNGYGAYTGFKSFLVQMKGGTATALAAEGVFAGDDEQGDAYKACVPTLEPPMSFGSRYL